MDNGPGGHSIVRQERSCARGVQAVADELLRLEAVRRSFDALALAFDDGEGDALGVVRDEVLVDAARVDSAVVHLPASVCRTIRLSANPFDCLPILPTEWLAVHPHGY